MPITRKQDAPNMEDGFDPEAYCDDLNCAVVKEFGHTVFASRPQSTKLHKHDTDGTALTPYWRGHGDQEQSGWQRNEGETYEHADREVATDDNLLDGV
jgi:hypothetical protein